MRGPLPNVASVRDFYAFEQHVKTCRKHRGLEMVPEWYEIPVFYFSNPTAILGDGDTVCAPRRSEALDYELELACVIDRECRDLPDDDRALEFVAGFTIMNDWSARDLQLQEMKVGLGPSKGKDFATSLGPELVSFLELADRYRDGRLDLEMTATVNGRVYSRGNASSMYWTWPQLLAHASRDATLRRGDVLGSGTVGTGCILELTPEAVGGWLKPGDRVELEIERIGSLRNTVGGPAVPAS
jgi:fumarylacetoacetate (FAA) hydrolase